MEVFFWQFLKSFVALFIITDSIGNLPFFLGLTEGQTQAEQRKVFTTALLTGFAILTGSLALWPRFIEARFSGLLDLAERLIGSFGQGAASGLAPGLGG